MVLFSMKNNFFIILHNIGSARTVDLFAKACYGLDFDNVVVTKASGSAAMAGVPEAQKLAFKQGKNLLFLADLSDAIELLKPVFLYMFAPKTHAEQIFSPEEAVEKSKNGKIFLIFGGTPSGLTRKELAQGLSVYLDLPSEIGTLGVATITLFQLHKQLKP
jgi:SpoU rRNA methylase family enzyme